MSASMLITTSGSISVSPNSTSVGSSSFRRTVIVESGSRCWYCTIVFAWRNFGASSSSTASSANSLPIVS